MAFFHREREGGEADESRARIEEGGIPLAAERRLQALGAGESAIFTSGLSVNEFSLLSRLGPTPLAQVMGASVVRPGLQLLPSLPPGLNPATTGGPWGPTVPSFNRISDASPSQVRSYKWRAEVVCQLDVLTEAWDTARRRALSRLCEEARHVGADAVAGVHLHRGDQDTAARSIEYVVNGTAIRLGNEPSSDEPVLTALSVQDLWRLHQAGYEAKGLIAASVAVFGSAPRATRIQRKRTTRRNQELSELSQAFHDARQILRTRLKGQVADARGDGVVGVEFAHTVHREKFSLASSLGSVERRGWHRGRAGVPYYVSGRGEAERRGWVITMHVAGTAVRRTDRSPSDQVRTAIRMGAP
jgi:uncharacterized protein YbjQ (UPF0145 family)